MTAPSPLPIDTANWPSPGASRARLEGLDVWRAVLTVMGIVLHATMLHPQLPLFRGIAVVSEAFRMGTFLFISGVLSGISLARRPGALWLHRRIVQIGVPAAFGWFVLCPIMTLGLARWLPPGLSGERWFALDWHHIWFLIALLLYSPVAYALNRWDAAAGLFERLEQSALQPHLIRTLFYAALPLTTFWLMTVAAAVILNISPPATLRMLSQCKLMLGYLPLFVTGLVMARSSKVREAVTAHLWPAVAILSGVLACYAAWYGWVCGTRWGLAHQWLEGVMRSVAMAWCPPAMAVLVLRSSIGGLRSSPLFRALGDASMTMYIVHYPILFALNVGFAWIAWPDYLEYAVAVVAGTAASYGVHRYLVCGTRLGALLLNGRTEGLRDHASLRMAAS